MSHKMLRPFIVKVSILGYVPLLGLPLYNYYLMTIIVSVIIVIVEI